MWVNYLKNFWGYGVLKDGGIWFLGIEEGGCNTYSVIEEKVKRFDVLSHKNKNLKVVDNKSFQIDLVDKFLNKQVYDLSSKLISTKDVPDYYRRFFENYESNYSRKGKRPGNAHFAFNSMRKFNLIQEFQATWAGYIWFLMELKNLVSSSVYNHSAPQRRIFQAERLGQIKEGDLNMFNHAIIELMPLPSPNIGTWNYGGFAIPSKETTAIDKEYGTGTLKKRRNYEKALLGERLNEFKNLLSEFNPKIIIVNGYTHKARFIKYFSQYNIVEMNGYWSNERSRTESQPLIFITQHSSRGLGGAVNYWKKLARISKDECY